MIYFSPAKINLGLHILKRRADGFHMLRSLMYPIGLCDIIEINQLSGEHSPVQFSQSGIRFESDLESNLCMKAWKLMASERALPPVAIHLHKQIPVGAGLGGGSSNASTVLKGLNHLASPPVPDESLAELAAQLGSDCPFFLHEQAMMMEGRGEILSQADVSLSNFYLILLFPGIHISTSEAYGAVTPLMPDKHLKDLLEAPVYKWKGLITNGFEKNIFAKIPLLREPKRSLYEAGAIYASMSGSGSSMFGVFETPPSLPEALRKYVIWKGPA